MKHSSPLSAPGLRQHPPRRWLDAVRAGCGGLVFAAGWGIPFELAAKAPGVTHCYKRVCHRVRSITETRALVGRTLVVSTSYYGPPGIDRFNRGIFTSNGERFQAGDPGRAASSDLPDGTELIIRNPLNGRVSHVRINDFGPFHGSRRLDVTTRVAADLGFTKAGVIDLEVTVIAAPRAEDVTYRRNRTRMAVKGALGAFDNAEMPDLIARVMAQRSQPVPTLAATEVVAEARQDGAPEPAAVSPTVVSISVTAANDVAHPLEVAVIPKVATVAAVTIATSEILHPEPAIAEPTRPADAPPLTHETDADTWLAISSPQPATTMPDAVQSPGEAQLVAIGADATPPVIATTAKPPSLVGGISSTSAAAIAVSPQSALLAVLALLMASILWVTWRHQRDRQPRPLPIPRASQRRTAENLDTAVRVKARPTPVPLAQLAAVITEMESAPPPPTESEAIVEIVRAPTPPAVSIEHPEPAFDASATSHDAPAQVRAPFAPPLKIELLTISFRSRGDRSATHPPT